MPGLFVAFEGVEGAGKGTQVALLAERFRARGQEPLLVREPGGTPLAESARELVLHGKVAMPPAAELFLYLVARADLVAKVIRPALAEGRAVIADRYELSTQAYQIAGRGLPEGAVKAAIAMATGGLLPDLYVVLDLPPEAGRLRQQRQGKSPDRVESADRAFHERVADAFRAARMPNVIHVPADRPPAEVHERVWRAMLGRFPQLA